MGNGKLQDIIGVIFDFNGTMFFDSEKHIQAWAAYVEDVCGTALGSRDIKQYIVNKSGRQIMEYFLGYEISEDMLELLDKEPARCLVFEDSVMGITSATNAGIRHIVAVNGDNPHLCTEGFEYIHAVIRDYTELNDSLVI